MGTQTVQTRRFSRQDYERLVADGFFHPEERLELVDGELIMMTPQGSRYATAVRLGKTRFALSSAPVLTSACSCRLRLSQTQSLNRISL